MFKVSQIFIYVCCNISFQRKQVEKFKIAYYFSICWKEGLFKSEIKRTGENTDVFVILRMLPQEERLHKFLPKQFSNQLTRPYFWT